MATTISFRVEKSILKDLSMIENNLHADRSEVIRKLLAEAIESWKLRKVLTDLSEHRVSIGKAAEYCGISLWEMLALAEEKNIDWTGYSGEDAERDLKLGG